MIARDNSSASLADGRGRFPAATLTERRVALRERRTFTRIYFHSNHFRVFQYPLHDFSHGFFLRDIVDLLREIDRAVPTENF